MKSPFAKWILQFVHVSAAVLLAAACSSESASEGKAARSVQDSVSAGNAVIGSSGLAVSSGIQPVAPGSSAENIQRSRLDTSLPLATIARRTSTTDTLKTQPGSLKQPESVLSPVSVKPVVTFVELGSVNCVPCKMMKPVLDAVERKYGDKVKVVFHDVWKPEGRPYAEQYRILAIPTQVFLDQDGNEYFRHTGYFPLEEVEKVLAQKGVR